MIKRTITRLVLLLVLPLIIVMAMGFGVLAFITEGWWPAFVDGDFESLL